ncbi:hypothetical protein [Spirosoma telluris]
MDRTLLILFVILGSIAAFAGFFFVLLDWVQYYTSGIYGRNSTEAIFETGALLLYTYFGIRFFNRHVSSLR